MERKNMLKKMEAVSACLAYVGSIALVCMMTLTTVDVAGRYLFNAPIIGVFEITEFLVLILIFSFIGYAQAGKAHVSVDLVVAQLPRYWQAIIDLFTHTVCLVLMGLITWMGVRRAFELMAVGGASPNLKVPVYPFVLFLALGCAVMCLQYVVDIIRLLANLREDPAP
jgi:TRAP-type transport system small permease protein